MKKALLLVFFVLLAVSSCVAVRLNGRSLKGNGKKSDGTSTEDSQSSVRIVDEEVPEEDPVPQARGPPADERMSDPSAPVNSLRYIKRSWNKESCAMCATIFWRMEVEHSVTSVSADKIPSCNNMLYGKRSLCRELADQMAASITVHPRDKRDFYARGHVNACSVVSLGACDRFFRTSTGGTCEVSDEEEQAPKQVSKCIQTYDYMLVYGPSFPSRRYARTADLSSIVDRDPKPSKAVEKDIPLSCSELCPDNEPDCRQDLKALCIRILSDPEERRVLRMCDRFERDDMAEREKHQSGWTLNSPTSVAFRKCEAMRSILSGDPRILVKRGEKSFFSDNTYDEFVIMGGDRTAAEEYCTGQLNCGPKPFWTPSRCADCMTTVKSLEVKTGHPYSLATCDRYLIEGESAPLPGSISHTEYTECEHLREFVTRAITNELDPPRLTDSEHEAVKAHTMTEPDVCAAVSLGKCSQQMGLTLVNFYERILHYPGVPEPFVPAASLEDVCRLEGVKARENTPLPDGIDDSARAAAAETTRGMAATAAQEKCETLACQICLASLPGGVDIDYCETMWMGEADSWRNIDPQEALEESKKTLVCRMVQQRLLNRAPYALAFWDRYMNGLCPWKTCTAIGVCGANHWPDDAPEQSTMPPCPCDPQREGPPTPTRSGSSARREHSAEPPAESAESCQNPDAMGVLLENGYDGSNPEWVRRYKLLHGVSDEELAALMADPGDASTEE